MPDGYALYRHRDTGRILLYIGITGDLSARSSSHIAKSKWMELVASTTIERYETLEGVREAERIAVTTEHPLFNVHYNSTPEAAERLRCYLAAVGRLDLLTQTEKPKRRTARRAAVEVLEPAVQSEVLREDEGRRWGEREVTAGPRFRRGVSSVFVRPAREWLGMDYAQFADCLSNFVEGWFVRPEVVPRWESRADVPGEILLITGCIVRQAVIESGDLPMTREAHEALSRFWSMFTEVDTETGVCWRSYRLC